MSNGTAKESNPKDALGAFKAYLSTVPSPVLFEVGAAFLEGACKYGRHNWRVIGVRASVYYDALMRHVMSWWEGQEIDPDSGMPHLVKAIACLMILRDAQRLGRLTDDRPPEHEDWWINEMNQAAKDILKRFPEPKPPYTEIQHGNLGA